ncbi:hypothetical protein [Candidatus Rariloculus sp.]|uniref:hypothetical protein n=1 Tax=Candidatus Rariloculus sp. TaxID=3101265 RepID=UPI003D14EAC0
MPPPQTQAEALLQPGAPAAGLLGARLIKPIASNFVERPWGGTMIREFKRLCPLPEQAERTGQGLGEAFEIAACDDGEVRDYPSRVRLSDGSVLGLAELLAAHGETLLGAEFVRRYGACFPLLPKTLDIKELLSVQAHPPGQTEVYVIIAAEPGATIRLGFNADIDPRAMKKRLARGLRNQQRLLELLKPGSDETMLQARLKAWFARSTAGPDELEAELGPALATGARWPAVADLLDDLKALYSDVLGTLNAIPVSAGQVIHNATPRRLLKGTRRVASAEVHALGNPERREILALEIRRPGPTLRAWDNVRFPIRAVDVDAALDAMNPGRTGPAEFLVTPTPVPGRPGTLVSVDSEYFRVEHLRPTPALTVNVPAQQPHCLHALSGQVVVRGADGGAIGALARGESALVPAGVGAYSIAAGARGADIVKASLPAADSHGQ